jgi:hypothetical protein
VDLNWPRRNQSQTVRKQNKLIKVQRARWGKERKVDEKGRGRQGWAGLAGGEYVLAAVNKRAEPWICCGERAQRVGCSRQSATNDLAPWIGLRHNGVENQIVG